MTARVLVVCTANVCRSPMAAALLQHHLRAAGADVQVTSAGTQAVRLPMDPVAVQAVAALGIDMTGHRPRPLDRDIVRVDGADLVITMTRLHLRHVATTDRESFRRTFTLRELGRALPVVTGSAGGLAAAVLAASAGRRPADLLRDDPADDIADPYGHGPTAVRRTAEEIDRLAAAVSAGLPWPSFPQHDHAPRVDSPPTE